MSKGTLLRTVIIISPPSQTSLHPINSKFDYTKVKCFLWSLTLDNQETNLWSPWWCNPTPSHCSKCLCVFLKPSHDTILANLAILKKSLTPLPTWYCWFFFLTTHFFTIIPHLFYNLTFFCAVTFSAML